MAEEKIEFEDEESAVQVPPSESEVKLRSAVSKLEAASDLRYFLTVYLNRVGLLPQTSVFHESPTVHARNAGMIDAGLILVEMLNHCQPLLWPTIQIEGLTYE